MAPESRRRYDRQCQWLHDHTNHSRVGSGVESLTFGDGSSQSGSLGTNNSVITGLNATNLTVGQPITGAGIPTGATITAVNPGSNSITISSPAGGISASTALAIGVQTTLLASVGSTVSNAVIAQGDLVFNGGQRSGLEWHGLFARCGDSKHHRRESRDDRDAGGHSDWQQYHDAE